MANKPTEDVDWAEGPNEIVSEPLASRIRGYVAGFIPPAAQHNWQFRAIGRWLRWLAAGGEYLAPVDGLDDTAQGDVFRVRGSFDYKTWALITSTGDYYWVHSDGRYLCLLTASGVIAYRLDWDADTSTSVFSTAPGITTPVKVVSNGTHLAVAHDALVQLYSIDPDTDTFTFVRTYNHGAAINDIALTDTLLCIVGVANGSSYEVEIFPLSGASGVGYTHGATAYAVCTPGAGAGAGNAPIFIFTAGDGGTGGNKQVVGLDATAGATWELDPSVFINTGARNIECDGSVCVIHTGNTGSVLIGVNLDGVELYATAPAALAGGVSGAYAGMDASRFYLSDVDNVWIADPQTGEVLQTIGAGTNRTVASVCSDGHHIYWANLAGTDQLSVKSYPTALRSEVWDHGPRPGGPFYAAAAPVRRR